MSRRIWIRRAYDPPSQVDGHRVLVDRLWPRGISKTRMRIDAWARHVAPTDELRHWFDHDPNRWDEFRTRYQRELEARTGEAALEFAALVEHAAAGRITLVYGARDTEHNNAVALREVLDRHISSRAKASPATPSDE